MSTKDDRQWRQGRMAEETAQVFITLMNTVGVEAKGPACLQAAAVIVAASYTSQDLAAIHYEMTGWDL